LAGERNKTNLPSTVKTFDYNDQAAGTSKDLSFAGTSGGFLGLDAGSAVALPEPGTWVFGFAALGAVVMRTRRMR
jgi:hypothetical protein